MNLTDALARSRVAILKMGKKEYHATERAVYLRENARVRVLDSNDEVPVSDAWEPVPSK
jgi:hypothetical protein